MAAPGEVVPVGRRSSARQVLRAGIGAAVDRLVEQEPVIRAGVDPEGIHQARVALRRLRSVLRTFAPILDPAWSEPLREELGWLAGELGAARDLDVLAGRLRAAIEQLGEDGVAATGLLGRLEGQWAIAHAAAVAALDGDRYLALRDRLAEAAREPHTLEAADRPADDVLPALARTAFGRLRRSVRNAGDDPSVEELHRLRIKAKRARYAVDLAVPVVGKSAKATAKAIGRLQDVLGEHQDRTVAEGWLREALLGADAPEAFAIGLLVADQRRQAEDLRAAWRTAWTPLADKRATAWMAG